MSAPLCTTKPAEFVSALLTSHMITTLILLDTNMAIWTLFCIHKDPISGLTLALILQIPGLVIKE